MTRASDPRDDSQRNGLILAGASIATVGIFIADLQEPLGYGIGILYVLVILFGLGTSWRGYPVMAALVATLLVIIDAIVGWSAEAPSFVFVNQPLMALVFMTTATLVTRFKRLERQSLDDTRQLADMKRAIDHAAIVATTDVTGRITYANDKFCEISKYAREELIGQDHRIINSGYHSNAFIRDLWRTIASGHVWHGELRNRAKDGAFYWVDTTIVPFVNRQGKPYQYIAIRADVTARKAAEERVAQQSALARVGQMAAVVAHEVRNPLAGIKGAVQVLMSRRAAEDPELPVMGDVVARIDALSDLINDLMVFARPSPPNPTVFALRPLLAEAIIMLRRDPVGASVEVVVDGPDTRLTADADMIRATILNLLLNAAQAMDGHGRIRLTISEDDRRCTIDVRDEGPGIPAAIREQVFEPFFTTKARGGGLGLAIARRTAELHNGRLALRCPDDGGTTISLEVPVRALPAVDGPRTMSEGGSEKR